MPQVDAPRLRLLARHNPASADLARRLLDVAPRALRAGCLGDGFSFTLRRGPDQAGQQAALQPAGRSGRYAAIAALGLRQLPEASRRAVLGGDDCDDLLALLAKELDATTSRGDAAIFCWAAAEAGHSELPHAISRLRTLDQPLLAKWAPPGDQIDVVSAAWVVTALVAARALADVEEHLAAARNRLIRARRALFPHLIGGRQAWYRAHVGSFADQVYPLQALARLHASADDQAALLTAQRVAGMLCQAQGSEGQWWWHYDARTGAVVERYPVYSVHQHAMAPMALLDLAEAGGDVDHEAIWAGLDWVRSPAESREPLIADELPVIWRKVARSDPGKLVRGAAAACTALRPGVTLPGMSALFPPGRVDHECRPYELGWLLYAWLSGAGR